jgi:hypothetical protein
MYLDILDLGYTVLYPAVRTVDPDAEPVEQVCVEEQVVAQVGVVEVAGVGFGCGFAASWVLSVGSKVGCRDQAAEGACSEALEYVGGGCMCSID